MKIYEKWTKLAYNSDGTSNKTHWEEYLPLEQTVYEGILAEKRTEICGTVSEIAKQFSMSVEFVAGFIDGINEALPEEIDVEKLKADTEVTIKIDFERLYKQMVEYKAQHLLDLPQWDGIFTKEKREELYKEQRNSKTIVKDKKPGRNEPCPCDSGKKYKKCCGANGN